MQGVGKVKHFAFKTFYCDAFLFTSTCIYNKQCINNNKLFDKCKYTLRLYA